MAVLQNSFHNHHRQQEKQQQQQQQQQHDMTTAVRIRATSECFNHLFPHQLQAREQRILRQRTNKLKTTEVVVGKALDSSVGDVLCHCQKHQSVNHSNQYTNGTTRSAKTTNQKQKETLKRKLKQKQNQAHASHSCLLGQRKVNPRDSAIVSTRNTVRFICSCNAYNFRFDSTLCIMITMFVFATIMISGNAVLAAQRDSLKVKDTKGLSNNANAISNGVDSVSNGNAGNGNGNGNGNAVNSIGVDTNTVSSGNAFGAGAGAAYAEKTITTTSFMNQKNQSHRQKNESAVVEATTVSGTTTTLNGAISSKISSHNNNNNAIASGSLQKANSLSGSSNAPSGNSGINRNTIEGTEDMRSGPYFDKSASKNVTALLGKTAYLNCRVKNLGNKTMLLQVSWVRHRDIHLLTVGRYTYTSDQRFRAIHQPQTEDWILQIKYPQHRDSGTYECQVSTTPHMSHYIHLNVVEPSTEIIGAPDLYIESGSTINLTCVILNSPEPPAYIFWNHNNAIINYDSPRGGVSVVTNKGETTTSFLLIKSARPTDSGLYQCNPSNAKPKSVTVHVLNGEFPAAMQRAGQTHHRMSPNQYLLVYLSLYLFTLAYVERYMKLSLQLPQPEEEEEEQQTFQRSTNIDGTPQTICTQNRLSQAVQCP